jgi:hypothetical protein
MKTTIEIPNEDLEQLIAYTGAKTKKEAINQAIKIYNKQHKMAKLAKKLGTFDDFISSEELNEMRAEKA